MLEKLKQQQKTIQRHAAQLKDMRVVGMLLFLVIVLLVSWSGAKAIDANYGLQKQISRLQQENAIQKLSNANQKLQNEYYETPQYLDVSARKEFGLAAPGETVLVVPRAVALAHTVNLPGSAEGQPKATVATQKKTIFQRNFNAWLDFLLHRQ